jgi:hypothetical protein
MFFPIFQIYAITGYDKSRQESIRQLLSIFRILQILFTVNLSAEPYLAGDSPEVPKRRESEVLADFWGITRIWDLTT